MSCGETDVVINGRPTRVYTENQAFFYPNDNLPRHAPGKPAFVDGAKVVYWVRPVFKNIWYEPCKPYRDLPRCGAAGANIYFTGAETSWSNNIPDKPPHVATCAKPRCDTFFEPSGGTELPVPVPGRSAMCGELSFDFKNKYVSPSAMWNVVNTETSASGKLEAVQIETGINCVGNADHFNFVLRVTRRGERGEPDERFLPTNAGLALLKNYCERKDGASFKIFTEKDVCDGLRTLHEKTYDLVLNNLCNGAYIAGEKICQDFCRKPDVNCDFRIQEYCSALPEKDKLDAKNRNVCACFMGNAFYKNYYDELNRKFKYPQVTSPDHTCLFDYCLQSSIKPSYVKQGGHTCPNVTTCFQVVNHTLDAGGNIYNYDIRVDQNMAGCSSVVAKCSSDKDCKSGSVCARSSQCVIARVPLPPLPPTTSDRPAQQRMGAASAGILVSLLLGLFVL